MLISPLTLRKPCDINIQEEKDMKKILVLALLVGAASLLQAADLRNTDSRGYGLEISSGASTTHTSINSNTTQSGGARDGAKIKIKETGSTITVSGDKTVVIKNGQLSQN
jgi:hypothetical protein